MKRLIADSIASIDGRLLKDDVIVNINGRNLKGMTQGDALNFLKDIPKVINLGVKRGVAHPPGTEDGRDSRSASRLSAASSLHVDQSPQAVVGHRPRSAPHGSATPPIKKNVREASGNASEPRGRSTSRTPSREQAPSTSARRSRSETRDSKPKEQNTPKKRPSSVSRLSRFFRGSSDSINTLGREDSGQQQPNQHPSSPSQRKRSVSSRSINMDSNNNKKKKNKNKKSPYTLLTVIFDKTDKYSFDFTLAGGVNTIYGDLPILVESVRKGSEIQKSLKVKDELISIQGIDVSRFPSNKVTDFLTHLPVGRVCMVVQRKS